MIQIIRMSELEEGTAVAAQAEGVELVVVKCNGRVSILEGRCPHQGAMLADGSVENGELVCNGHRWRFDCLTGEKLNNPKTCLKTFSARIEGDQVLVSEQEVIDWKRAAQKKATVDPARHAGRSLKDLPGPKGIPLLGNLLQLDLNRLHLVLEKWCEEFGPIYTIDLPHRSALVIADPELINNILRERPETYRRVGSIEPIFKVMGINGVFSAEGESWRRQRRLTMQALSTNHLRQFFDILIKV